MNKHKIEIYTDGSSFIKFKEKFYEASSGVLIYLDDKLIYSAGLYHTGGTNSIGELYALLIGLCKLKELLKQHSELTDSAIYVFADSDYVIKSVTTYIKSWVKQGINSNWISYSTKKDVAYQSIFKYLYSEFLYKHNPYNIIFYHINSHINKGKKGEEPLNKARFAFMKRNEIEISLDEFKLHSNRNDEVDKLSEKIRLNKTYFEEHGDSTLIKMKDILTRDDRIVIRKRKIK